MVRIGVMLVGMKRWIAAAALAAGCYRSSPPPESPEPPRPAIQEPEASRPRFRPVRRPAHERSLIADALVKLGEFADDMCACTDRTCADTVSQEMTRWSADLAKDTEDFKPTPEEMEEATRVTERLSQCMVTAMGYGAGGPTP
jgi:hypothetical protein